MRRIPATLVVCLAAVLGANAQSARVSGQVLDSRQAAVKGSQVTLRNIETDGNFRTESTEDGAFLLPPVPPGRYEISASSEGFAPTRITDLVLELGQSKVLAIELKPASEIGRAHV